MLGRGRHRRLRTQPRCLRPPGAPGAPVRACGTCQGPVAHLCEPGEVRSARPPRNFAARVQLGQAGLGLRSIPLGAQQPRSFLALPQQRLQQLGRGRKLGLRPHPVRQAAPNCLQERRALFGGAERRSVGGEPPREEEQALLTQVLFWLESSSACVTAEFQLRRRPGQSCWHGRAKTGESLCPDLFTAASCPGREQPQRWETHNLSPACLHPGHPRRPG